VYPCTRTHAPPGVRGKQFLGVRKILARISPNLHEKFLGHFLCKYFLTKTVFVMISKTRSSRASANVGCHFFNQTKLGTIFVHIFREFAQIFKDFAKVSADFAQIFTKSKLLEAPPAPPPPTCSLVNCRGPLVCKQQTSLCLFIDIINFPSITFSSRPEGSKMKVSQSAKECHTWFHGGGKIQINCCIY